jgi:hypothetical protein
VLFIIAFLGKVLSKLQHKGSVLDALCLERSERNPLKINYE